MSGFTSCLTAAVVAGASIMAVSVLADDPGRRLERAEANPVLADPEELTEIVEACRRAGDDACTARALLARADCLNQGERLSPEVGEDASAAAEILRPQGPSAALARALLLMRHAGADPADAARVERKRLTEAIEMAAEVGDGGVEGRALCQRSALLLRSREFEAALADLQRARAIGESGDHPRVAACAPFHEGLAYYFQWKPAEARRIWIELTEAVTDRRATRELLWTRVGISAVSINPFLDTATAIEQGRAAVELARLVHGDLDASKAYVNLASALQTAGRWSEVLEVAPTALELSRRANSPAGELIALRSLGAAQGYRGDLVLGLERMESSIVIARRLGDRFNLMLSLMAAGRILRLSGRYSDARSYLNEAEQIAEGTGVPFWQSNVLTAQAVLRIELGDLAGAAELADLALNVVGPADRGARVWALDARGRVRQLQEDLDGALDDFREAFRLFGELDLIAGRCSSAIEIGNVYFRLGRADRAAAYYRRAIQLAELAGADSDRRIAEGNLVLIDIQLGRLGDHTQALLARADDLSRGVSLTDLNGALNVAETLITLGELDAALPLVDSVLGKVDQMGVGRFSSRAHRVKAAILSRRGQHDEAIELCHALLRDTTGDPRFLMQNRWTCGKVFEAGGQSEEALAQLHAAAATAEAIRREVERPELRASLLADRTAIYADLVGALITVTGARTEETVDEALAISERFRSWNLLESLAGDHRPPELETPGTRASLLERMAQLHLKMRSAPVAERESLLDELRTVEDRLSELPSTGDTPFLLGRSVATLQEIRSATQPGTVLLEYLLNQTSAFAIAIDHEHAKVVRLDTSGWELANDVSLFRSLLRSRRAESRRDREAIRRIGSRLFRTLMEPLDEFLENAERLVVCPDLALHELPFEALVDPDGRFLVESTEVTTVPSLGVYLELQRRRGAPADGIPLVALANPREAGSTVDPLPDPDPLLREGMLPLVLPELPYSEDEARVAVRHAGRGSELLTGSRATEAAARAALESGAAVVHFAMHGFLDSASIGRSGLLLAPDAAQGDDGLLQAREVVDLDIEADLIVLSGCSTGGRVIGGEGLIGLPHALFQSGASAVVMSLWEIRDRAASVFMDRFYQRLAEGLTVGAALRAAKLDLIHSGRDDLAHPSVWSPFVLGGLGELTIELQSGTERGVDLWTVASVALLVLAAVLWIAARRTGRS